MKEIEQSIEKLKALDRMFEEVPSDAILVAIESLEKQIPKKVINSEFPYCPHCERVFVTSNDDYCHRYGGKIDWSDSK